MTTTDQHNTPPLTAESPEWALRGRLMAHPFFTQVKPEHEQQMVDFILQQIAEAKSAAVQEPVAWRAWFDADSGARWLFTLWPEEERLDVKWEPLYTAPPAQPAPVQEPVAWRELCRRLYVELFHCDQDMTHYDEEGKQMWTTGKTVSDVLRDAKAALDTTPPAQPAGEPDALHLAAMDLARKQHDRIAELEALLAAAPAAQPAPAQPVGLIDDAVTPEYLAWLEAIYPRHGVGGNVAWNAGVRWERSRKVAAQPTLPELSDPEDCRAWCPRCDGTGDEVQMSDSSPDAHEVTVNCRHCDGAGTLYAEHEAYSKACGEIYFSKLAVVAPTEATHTQLANGPVAQALRIAAPATKGDKS
jgi:hypothetical protein